MTYRRLKMELVQMPYTTARKAEVLLREVAAALDELAAAQTDEEEADRILEMRSELNEFREVVRYGL
jgi:hypothetical protein